MDNRMKLVTLFSAACFGMTQKGLIPDEEIDNLWNMSMADMRKEIQDQMDAENPTFGQMVDHLLEEFERQFG